MLLINLPKYDCLARHLIVRWVTAHHMTEQESGFSFKSLLVPLTNEKSRNYYFSCGISGLF